MSEGPFDRGHVVWHGGLFRDTGRPWVVLSDDRHPFHGEAYLVDGITGTERNGAIPLPDGAWSAGGLPRASYASPWFMTTLKHSRIGRGVGAIEDGVVREVIAEAGAYLGAV